MNRLLLVGVLVVLTLCWPEADAQSKRLYKIRCGGKWFQIIHSKKIKQPQLCRDYCTDVPNMRCKKWMFMGNTCYLQILLKMRRKGQKPKQLGLIKIPGFVGMGRKDYRYCWPVNGGPVKKRPRCRGHKITKMASKKVANGKVCKEECSRTKHCDIAFFLKATKTCYVNLCKSRKSKDKSPMTTADVDFKLCKRCGAGFGAFLNFHKVNGMSTLKKCCSLCEAKKGCKRYIYNDKNCYLYLGRRVEMTNTTVCKAKDCVHRQMGRPIDKKPKGLKRQKGQRGIRSYYKAKPMKLRACWKMCRQTSTCRNILYLRKEETCFLQITRPWYIKGPNAPKSDDFKRCIWKNDCFSNNRKKCPKPKKNRRKGKKGRKIITVKVKSPTTAKQCCQLCGGKAKGCVKYIYTSKACYLRLRAGTKRNNTIVLKPGVWVFKRFNGPLGKKPKGLKGKKIAKKDRRIRSYFRKENVVKDECHTACKSTSTCRHLIYLADKKTCMLFIAKWGLTKGPREPNDKSFKKCRPKFGCLATGRKCPRWLGKKRKGKKRKGKKAIITVKVKSPTTAKQCCQLCGGGKGCVKYIYTSRTCYLRLRTGTKRSNTIPLKPGVWSIKGFKRPVGKKPKGLKGKKIAKKDRGIRSYFKKENVEKDECHTACKSTPTCRHLMYLADKKTCMLFIAKWPLTKGPREPNDKSFKKCRPKLGCLAGRKCPRWMKKKRRG